MRGTDGSPAVIAAAQQLADDVLWPQAQAIDEAATVPVGVLDQFAAAGLYGVAGPIDAGGSDLDGEAMGRVTEALGGASLATAFVWIQHHSALRAVAASRPEVRDRWLADMCAGTVRSGIAYAALRRPGPPAMTARSAAGASPDPAAGGVGGVGGDVLLDGFAPWVTGWGLIDTVYVGARDGDDMVWALLDAADGPTATTRPLRLAAVDSSCTVALRLEGHPVAAERVVSRERYTEWRARDGAGIATNGFLAVGLAARCADLLDAHRLHDEVGRARRRLVVGRCVEDLVAARAEASLLAMRAATAVVAAGGGRSVGAGDQAQRLLREAMFLLVFGQTGAIRQAQLAMLVPD